MFLLHAYVLVELMSHALSCMNTGCSFSIKSFNYTENMPKNTQANNFDHSMLCGTVSKAFRKSINAKQRDESLL